MRLEETAKRNTDESMRRDITPAVLKAMLNVSNRIQDELFTAMSPEDREALFRAFINRDRKAGMEVLARYLPEEEKIRRVYNRKYRKWRDEGHDIAITSTIETFANALQEPDKLTRKENFEEAKNYRRVAKEFVEIQKEDRVLRAERRSCRQINQEAQRYGEEHDLSQTQINEIIQGIATDSFSIGYSLADVIVATPSAAVARNLAGQAHEITKEKLYELTASNQEISEKEAIKKAIMTLLSLDRSTVDAAEEAISRGEGIERVADSLLGHIDTLAMLHSGNLNIIPRKVV